MEPISHRKLRISRIGVKHPTTIFSQDDDIDNQLAVHESLGIGGQSVE